ncbi:MAG: DUF1624 domain-containing protein [Actinomycetota bacterium]|nr:MAG: DUF1624 domain-containing protein [Actinomycetota bacterium]
MPDERGEAAVPGERGEAAVPDERGEAAVADERGLAGLHRGGRIVGVDVARGVALLGMLAVHLLPAVDGGQVSLGHAVAAGRSAALFALLAGVTIALTSGGPVPPRGLVLGGHAAALAARAAMIALLGLALGSLGSGLAVILTYYGLLFAVAIPLLRLPARALATMAALAVVVAPVLSQLLRTVTPEPSLVVPSFAAVWADPLGQLRDVGLTGYYPVLSWSAYLLAGMAVGRLALRRWQVGLGLLVGGAVLAGVAHTASWLLLDVAGGAAVVDPAGQLATTARYGTTPTDSWWWLAVDVPHSGTPLDLAATIGSSLFVLGLALLAVRLLPRLLFPLAAVGAMPLTLYCVHVVVLAVPDVPRSSPAALLTQAVVALLAATAWRVFVGRGPLETLVGTVAQAARVAALSSARPPPPPSAPAG